MGSLKILHVVATMDPKMGGVCQAIRMIIKGLSSFSLANEIVSLDGSDESYISNSSLTIHALGKGKGPWCYNQNLAVWLKENLTLFDIVIIHGLWLYPSYASIKAIDQSRKKGAKVPKIFVMPHGMLDPYFQLAKGRKIKAIRNWIYWKLIESKVVNGADGMLFTCEEEKKLAAQSFRPYRPKQEYVVGLGVEQPPVFSEQMREAFFDKCPEVKGKNFLLFLSRIHEKKGVDLLLHAYLRVYNEKRKTPVLAIDGDNSDTHLSIPKLVIAGPGIESPYGQRLKKMVDENHFLEDQVYFPGMLSGEAKWGAFYECDAFVLPSHQENFGIAVAEAMSCSKPVLISNQVNIWREIEASGGGLIADDSAEGTQNLLQLWEEAGSGARVEMGENAAIGFKDNFSISLTSKKFMRAINSNSDTYA